VAAGKNTRIAIAHLMKNYCRIKEKTVGTSVNGQVCHGIPSNDVFLGDGDIINVDV